MGCVYFFGWNISEHIINFFTIFQVKSSFFVDNLQLLSRILLILEGFTKNMFRGAMKIVDEILGMNIPGGGEGVLYSFEFLVCVLGMQ